MNDLDTVIPVHQGLFKLEEAALLLACSERTLRRHIEKGALTVVRVGPFGMIRITRQELLRYARVDQGAAT